MAEILSGFASTAINGEHLWLGVIYTNMTHHLQEQGLDFPITSHKPCAKSNRWKQTVLNIITPLLEAAKEMWAIKETSRREAFLREPTAEEKLIQAQRNRRRGDIRSWFSRLADKTGSLRKRLNKTSTPILVTPPLMVPPPKSKPRWTNTTIQDHFRVNREHIKEMIQRNSEKKVHFPRSFLVNLRDNGELDWLPPKQAEDEIPGRRTDKDTDDGEAEMTEILDSPKKIIDTYTYNTNLNIHNYNISIDNNNSNSNTFNNIMEQIRKEDAGSSSSGSSSSSSNSNLRGSHCSLGSMHLGDREMRECSSSNLAEDDVSKRRGVG
jgi:hypothetical protein